MSGARPSTSAASQRRRTQIVETTRDLLRESSADKILVADIAAEAGVSVATIYNLIGQRDRVLVAVLDHTAQAIREQIADDTTSKGIDRCLAVLAVSCKAILAEPAVHRNALVALGEMSSEVWLDEGLYETIDAAVTEALALGQLDSVIPVSSTAAAVQLGFRGALMSWAFGQLDDRELLDASQLGAALSLAATATGAHRKQLLDSAAKASYPKQKHAITPINVTSTKGSGR